MWWLQAAMADLIMVLEGDSQVVLDKFAAGTLESDLWQELVTPSARGRLLSSSGTRVTQLSKARAHGDYRFYAATEAGEQQ